MGRQSVPRDLPQRPRLSEDVLPRHYLAGGDGAVVLHDTRNGGVIRIDPRAWTILSCADGTRDLDGIAGAAAVAGVLADAGLVRQLLTPLLDAGLIVAGVNPSPLPAMGDASRPLEVLDGYRSCCDGRGSCCRRYATVIFSPLEAARARAALPEICGGGDQPRRLFTPERGTSMDGPLAVALTEGACVYLDAAGRCLLHERGGAGAKPVGCRLFPRTFVDDGESVRVSVALECACVIASVGSEAGEPLVVDGIESRGQLDGAVHVRELPQRVLLDETGATAPRRKLAAWSRRLARASVSADVPDVLWALADTVASGGLDEAVGMGVLTSAPPLTDVAIVPWFSALAKVAQELARSDAQWRNPDDIPRIATAQIAAVAAGLTQPQITRELLAHPPPERETERFYLRASLFGHRWVGRRSVAVSLRDAAVRLLLARAVALSGGLDLRLGGEHPLALVEAMLRGHGLDEYVERIGCMAVVE